MIDLNKLKTPKMAGSMMVHWPCTSNDDTRNAIGVERCIQYMMKFNIVMPDMSSEIGGVKTEWGLSMSLYTMLVFAVFNNVIQECNMASSVFHKVNERVEGLPVMFKKEISSTFGYNKWVSKIYCNM